MATQELKRVDTQTQKVVEKTIERVFMLLVARAKGNQALVGKFIDKLTSSANINVPTPLEPLMSGAIDMIETELSS